MNHTFNGYSTFFVPGIGYFDWMLLLLNGNGNSKAAITAVTLSDYCLDASRLYHTTCLETMLKGGIPPEIYASQNYIIAKTALLNLTSSFRGIFSTLWHASLPCHDTLETRLGKLNF